MATVSHYDAQTMIDIFGSTQGRDLGGVAKDIDAIVNGIGAACPAVPKCLFEARSKRCALHSSGFWPGWDSRFS